MSDGERVQIGWQSMSAAGGGGGMLATFAMRQPFADAVAAVTAERGAPDHVDGHRAVWSSDGGASTERLEIYVPDALPGHVPVSDAVPPGTGHVRVEMSLFMRSASDAPQPSGSTGSIAGTPAALAIAVVIAAALYGGYWLLTSG